jgi:glutaredoxin 3
MIIYTKSGCPYCAAAVAHYTAEGTDFEERNISDSAKWRDEALSQCGGDRRVPVIVDDDGSASIGWEGGG